MRALLLKSSLLLLASTGPVFAGGESTETETQGSTAVDTALTESSVNEPVVNEADLVLAPFRLEFELKAFGLSGESIIELTRSGNPENYQYEYSSVTQAKGMAKLIRPNAATETSRFEMRGQQIYVDEYRVDSGSGDPEEDSYARFDWNLGIAFSNHQEERVDVLIEDGVLDRSSADLQVSIDLQNGREPVEYDMVHRNQVKTYQFYREGEETIETKAGSFETIKYLRQRKGSSRSAYIWYAPALDYQPVKVIQLKDGKSRGTLLLSGYQMPDLGNR